jgi:hypothetical protein
MTSRIALLITAALVACTLPSAAQPPEDRRSKIEINGAPLGTSGRQALEQLETRIGEVPEGRYWYDAMTGAAGRWGGPTTAFLPPGLPLAGAMPAQASGGGDGRLTGVFVNGRELHPLDVRGLQNWVPVRQGRYWWDAAGNVGLVGGGMLFNFNVAVASRQPSGGGNTKFEKYDPLTGKGHTITKGCAAVSGRRLASDSSTAYDYYVGC